MTACKQCGGEVRWVQIDGRWHCHNQDGSDHWDECSKRRWQQVVATGERFVTKRASGYANSVHGTKYDRISAGVVRGKRYKPSGQCKQCVPPWETCNGCPDQIAA